MVVASSCSGLECITGSGRIVVVGTVGCTKTAVVRTISAFELVAVDSAKSGDDVNGEVGAASVTAARICWVKERMRAVVLLIVSNALGGVRAKSRSLSVGEVTKVEGTEVVGDGEMM